MGLAKKTHFDLDELFKFLQYASARNKEDDVVAVLNADLGVMPHNDFAGFAADDGGDMAAARPFDIGNPSADNGRGGSIAMNDGFDCLRRTASQGVDGNNVSPAYMGEYRTDGDEVG